MLIDSVGGESITSPCTSSHGTVALPTVEFHLGTTNMINEITQAVSWIETFDVSRSYQTLGLNSNSFYKFIYYSTDPSKIGVS